MKIFHFHPHFFTWHTEIFIKIGLCAVQSPMADLTLYFGIILVFPHCDFVIKIHNSSHNKVRKALEFSETAGKN